ncbi:MAG: metallophosphoesterase [Selenomonadaceae bacterium]|nr:metallophosphoesterase [Selenomonadaceae bacterium]
MKYRRILAMGDMHGHFSRALSVFRKVKFDENQDLLIFLGDYVDRGDENLRCLRWAMEMSEKPNVIALRGNHEQMMMEYYLMDGEGTSRIWLPNGGNLTKLEMDTWLKKDPTALKRVLKFIAERPLYHRIFAGGKEFIFVHAGLKPGIALENQSDQDLLWIREEFYENYTGSAEVICGHTPIPYMIPDKYDPIRLPNHITMIDTGSFFPHGRISCVDVLTGTVYQSDADWK